MPLYGSKIGSILPRTLPTPLGPRAPKLSRLDSTGQTEGGFGKGSLRTTQVASSSEDVATLESMTKSTRGGSVRQVQDAESEVL